MSNSPASAGTTTKVKGLAELQAALDQLPAKLEANVMRGAIRAGLKVLRDEAKRLVPVGLPNDENVRLYGGYLGLLRDSIRLRVNLRNGTITGRVVAGGNIKGSGKGGHASAYYAHWVEHGTKAHIIKASGQRGALLIAGGAPVHTVMHPGARPQPFMRPALDAQAQAAVQASREYIRQRLATKHGIDVPAPLEEDDS